MNARGNVYAFAHPCKHSHSCVRNPNKAQQAKKTKQNKNPEKQWHQEINIQLNHSSKVYVQTTPAN